MKKYALFFSCMSIAFPLLGFLTEQEYYIQAKESLAHSIDADRAIIYNRLNEIQNMWNVINENKNRFSPIEQELIAGSIQVVQNNIPLVQEYTETISKFFNKLTSQNYHEMTAQIEELRQDRRTLLQNLFELLSNLYTEIIKL